MFKYVVSRMVCLDQFRLQMNCSLYVCEDSQESCESFDFIFNCVILFALFVAWFSVIFAFRVK